MSNEIVKNQTALELSGFKNELVENLAIGNTNLNRAIKARLEEPISTLTESQLKTLIADQVQKCAANLGQRQVDTEIIAQIISELFTELSGAYRNWTPTEVKEAFRLGSIGKLGGGELHLSARNLLIWIEQYNSQVRKQAFNAIKKAKEDEAKRLSNTKRPESDNLSKDERRHLIMSGWEMYNTGQDFGYSIYYKHLAALGLVKLEKPQLWDWIRKGVVDILKECSQEVGFPAARNRQRTMKTEIKGIDFSLEDNATLPSYVKVRAQTLIVKDFYKGKSKDDINQVMK